MTTHHRPLGPNASWKTGQRVPITGHWVDQHGQVNLFEERSTFPPVVSSKGGDVAYRTLVKAVSAA
jgi:hypothetical protein